MTGHLLDAVDRLLTRFVAFPTDHDRHAVAAWVLHTWTVDAFDSTPRLALLSPEKGSGKTRTIEVLELLVPNPKHTVNMSASVLFRLVGDPDLGTVTLLMDEADTYLGWKVARENEDIRGLVNAGHRRGATCFRMNMEGGASVEEFPAYAPVALAGIGDLPDTIIDRSIVIGMKRRSPTEQVEPFRRRKVEPTTAPLREALEAWGADHVDQLADLLDHLELPAGIEDRAADVWEPLIAIGALAGEPWQDRLTAAASSLNSRRADRDPSLGIQLLRDIRDVFDQLQVDRIPSAELADQLADIEGAPWADLRGVPIDAQGIAKRLRAYEVRPDSHRFGDHTARGYLREDFYDAWRRYLPPAGGRDTRDMRDTEPAPDTDVTDVTVSRRGDGTPCQGCGGPADRTSAMGTPWCSTCWDREAGEGAA
jgi:hypothetical protein